MRISDWSSDVCSSDLDGFVGDPYASDKPKFTITAQNYEQYKDNLTPGQIAMLKRYPDSYRLPVYETRRSAAMPQHVYDAATRNATQTNMVRGGNGLENFEKAVAFPRSEEHTSELQSLMRISYAVFCLKKKKK